jgi:hypothetical protein
VSKILCASARREFLFVDMGVLAYGTWVILRRWGGVGE